MQYRSISLPSTFSGNALLTHNTPATSAQTYTNNTKLRAAYSSLKKGDIFIGRLRLRKSEEYILLDMVERGIILFPSALSQQICRSKAAQALLFSDVMLPHTRAIHDKHDMLEAVSYFHKHSLGQVVSKLDRKDGGLGIHLWPDIEDVYNQASLGIMPYPFVIQPYIAESKDVRVIILDSYEEAYLRENPHNFRNNLHCGGSSSPYLLTHEQRVLCEQIMSRGKFPYAHIDLMVTGSGKTYLTEVNLRGGIRGAQITPDEYRERVDAIHASFTRHIEPVK
jgi:ribosomal protein S6--L-glutamate ligase